ncbi:substrate-binding domain-containing protein [Agarivorans aestuarii]|uniref:Substrate-binding domain-containing protein n=1 Tax=Agarivorans aestuarii TaxID=1563703 RepID=A0ABU7GA94_9ALTE|nr:MULTISPECIES: substrate-binding domain-containing protein [Agarivorans]MEE1675994.1 substrate-binding domain-containing protein [Agarivorans aestuarii]
MATIKDVAAAAGVSVATVSRVVNNGPKVSAKNRDLVKKVMLELGYRPNANARALVTQTNPTLGLVFSELTDPFFATLAGGVEKVTRNNNIQLLISNGLVSAESEKRAIETLLEQRCQALVVHSKALSNQALIDYAEAVPALVLINRYIPEIAHRCVWLDNQAGGEAAARHLLSLGHKNIACITSSYDIEDPRLRLEGVKSVLSEQGMPLAEHAIASSDPNEIGGEIAAQNLLARGLDFTALIVYNDSMASGAITVLCDNGYRVPEDVSVIGFDDVLLSRYLRPKLTTMRYPIEMMAMEAAEMSLALASGESVAPIHKYVPTLVKRDSVSQPKD